MPLKSESHHEESDMFQWCQRRSPPERYAGEDQGAGKRKRKEQVLSRSLEHGFNVIRETEFESGKKRGIGDFGKPQKSLSSLQM